MSNPKTDDRSWWIRYSIGLTVIILLNGFTLYQTWSAPGLDGSREVGWPVVFHRTGYASFEFVPEGLLIDAFIAVVVPILIANLMRDGFFALVHRIRTWGTPWEDTPYERSARPYRFTLSTMFLVTTLVALLLGAMLHLVRQK